MSNSAKRFHKNPEENLKYINSNKLKDSKEMGNKRSKGFYITLWSILALAIFGIGVYAATYTINSQGVFVDGNRSFARTADVVVCRGTSLLDDVVKQFQCDVVCLSTDSDCSQELNNSISEDIKVR